VFSLVDRALVEADTRIMYLGFSKGRCRRLVQIRDVIVQQIIGLADRSESLAPPLRTYVLAECRNIQEKCTRMKSRVAREVAEHVRGYQRQQEMRRLLAGQRPGDHALAPDTQAEVREKFGKEVSKSNPVAWMNWWRHVGTLGTASRSYDRAASAFKKVLSPDLLSVEPDDVVDCIFAKFGHDAQREMLAIAKVFVRKLQLDVARIKLGQRLGKDVGQLDEIRREAIRDYERAWHLLDAVHSQLWYEVRNSWRRIETYRAVIEASKPAPDFGVARRFLNSAERHVLQFDPRRKGLAVAVIELHRADVSINEALSLELEAGRTFGNFRETLCRLSVSSQLRRDPINEQVRGAIGEVAAAGFRRVQGALQYALAALDRARPILLRHERNVWWSTWYFERRMKAAELVLWAAVGEKGGQIPFLGLEAAPSVATTIIDDLMDDARRMVRLDVYRLATVVDCYLNCLRALRVRLCCDAGESTDRLVLRQQRMSVRLVEAGQALSDVLHRRRDLGMEKNAPLEPDIEQYVAKVCREVQELAGCSPVC